MDNSKELIGRISLRMNTNDKLINGIRDQTDIINVFKNINEDIMNNIVIKGIKNIKDIIVSENKSIHDPKRKINTTEKHELDHGPVTRYNLETDGTNLLDILKFNIFLNLCSSNIFFELIDKYFFSLKELIFFNFFIFPK